MRLSASLLLSACALLVPGLAQSQEVAGRVLVAVGDVSLTRGAQKIAAPTGTEVRTGDTIEVGERSGAQIRMTDESIVALRAGSLFRITEYAFQGRTPETQSAFFNLLKGGMRTVTGLIGRSRQDRYRVATPNATVGIRGTHYTLVYCNDDCYVGGARADSGGLLFASAGMLAQSDAGAAGTRTLAPNGLFGEVSDSTIVVTTEKATAEFSKGEFFRVSENLVPERLIGPPEQLREARVTAGGKPAAPKPGAAPQAGTGSETAQARAQTGSDGGTGDVGVSGTVSKASEVPVALATNVFLPTENATTLGPAAVLAPTFSGTVFYRLQGPFSIPLACSSPPCETFTEGEITIGVNFALQSAGVSVSVKAPTGEILNLGTPFTSQGLPITVSGGQASFSGTFNLADHPQNTGAFRCNQCGPGDTPGFLSTMTFSGTISGSQATLTIFGADSDGDTGMATAVLNSAVPPNNDVAAISVPRFGGGANARSAAFWNVQLDASRRLIDFGPPVGQIKANVGTSTNTIAGSNASAGNLVWGAWTGGGAQITDTNYVTFVTAAPDPAIPWITGTATNTLPPSLGVLTYTPVGGLINNGGAVLNSGSITANFVSRTMSLSLDATRTTGDLNRFVMSGSSGFSATTGRFSAGFANVQCVSGPCIPVNPIGGSFGGFFAGAQAEGAGVAFTAGFGAGTGLTGVVGFKR